MNSILHELKIDKKKLTNKLYYQFTNHVHEKKCKSMFKLFSTSKMDVIT